MAKVFAAFSRNYTLSAPSVFRLGICTVQAEADTSLVILTNIFTAILLFLFLAVDLDAGKADVDLFQFRLGPRVINLPFTSLVLFRTLLMM